VASDVVERRLAAILSADVAGYSRLMAEDEVGTVRTLSAYREQMDVLIREHRGRTVDTPGDNLLAEFASATDAVQCAVAIQRVLRARNAGLVEERRMQFRVGVHLGEVMVEGNRIYGDGVNIAARLEGLASAGGVCLSATVHDQVRNKLDIDFDDVGDHSVKNIPDQVHVYAVQLGSDSGGAAPRARPRGASRRLRTGGIAAAVFVLAAVALWMARTPLLGLAIEAVGLSGPPENPPLPDRASVVVLPFTNMSGDPEQEYFSDGITEDLTTELSRNPFLFVIGRSSAFTYKGRPVKIADVGRELGVRYVLEGSVRKAGEQVRITAQLIDATTGFHIWSERFDRELADIFALQSEIAEEILTALQVEITAAETERIRRKPTENLTAYDLYQKALYHLNRFTRADNRESRRLLERALELDPQFAMAYSLLGATYSVESGFGWNYDPALQDRAEQLVRKAIGLNPSLPAPYIGLAAVHLFRRESQAAIEAADRAIALAPNVDAAHFFRGMGLAGEGDYVAATQAIRRALRLNPRATSGYMVVVAAVNLAAGQRQAAMELLERLRASNPELINARISLAALYEQDGRHDEARAVVEEILAVNADLTADTAVNVGGMSALLASEVEEYRAALRSLP
jgi:TolB-like protein/class 3 adenylate cyclase/cytochrome c-type biogenesis protein CcmH/NrfG